MSPRQLLEKLESLGVIDPKGLFLALKEQVRLRLLDCFGCVTRVSCSMSSLSPRSGRACSNARATS